MRLVLVVMDDNGKSVVSVKLPGVSEHDFSKAAAELREMWWQVPVPVGGSVTEGGDNQTVSN